MFNYCKNTKDQTNPETFHLDTLNPESCDRFNICSAMICPLDPEWRKRKHLKGERVCLYLTDAVKCGAEAIFRGAGRGKLYEVIQTHLPDIIAVHAPIKYAAQRAKKTGFRLEYKRELAA